MVFSALPPDADINGLDFDWVTSNIYATTFRGCILACDTKADRGFPCVEVLTDQRYLMGIALNPITG